MAVKRKSRLQQRRDNNDTSQEMSDEEERAEEYDSQQTKLSFGSSGRGTKRNQPGKSKLDSLLNQLDDDDDDDDNDDKGDANGRENMDERSVDSGAKSSAPNQQKQQQESKTSASSTSSSSSSAKRVHPSHIKRDTITASTAQQPDTHGSIKRQRIAGAHRDMMAMPRQQGYHMDAMLQELPPSVRKLNPYQLSTSKQSPWKLQGDTLPFYFLDAYETPTGDVILFGKTGVQRDPKTEDFIRWESCAVKVRNLTRTVHLYPRENPLHDPNDTKTLKKNVQEAAQKLVEQSNIPFKSRPPYSGVKMRAIKKHYVFEETSVPHRKDLTFVEMHIPSQRPDGTLNPAVNLRDDHTTFGHVFGANSSFLETLLLKQNIMGPCWLSIKVTQPKNRKFSHCLHEFEASGYQSVKRLVGKAEKVPPAVVCAIKAMTMLSENNKFNEVVVISGVVFSNFEVDGETKDADIERNSQSFSFCRSRLTDSGNAISGDKNDNEGLRFFDSEKQLLEEFLDFIDNMDPDVIVGHNFISFDLDVLLHRMKELRIESFSKLGRPFIPFKNFPRLHNNVGGMGESTWQEKMVMSGRLICDTYLASREYLRESSYSLLSLSQTQLSREKVEISHDQHALQPYYQSAKTLRTLSRHCEHDALLSFLLMNKLTLLPLSKQMTNIAGNLWSRTLTGNRAERVEYLLLHKFYDNNFIIPDKHIRKSFRSGRRKAAYSGGMVIDPKRGLHDKYVLLIDFNSLYPSIIREYNICFTSVKRKKGTEPQADSSDDTESSAEEPSVVDETDPMYQSALLPRIIADLISERQKVKSELGRTVEPNKRWKLDTQQQALKLTANSTYGCLGFHLSRFFCQPIAELITRNGRNILTQTKRFIEESMSLPVIYGDTDSLMILTTETVYDRAEALGKKVIREINNKRRFLQIGIDGLLRKILLLQKKKYAAVIHSKNPKDGTIVEKLETKGLEQVRRDWCQLSKQASQFCLDQILKGNVAEEEVVNAIHNYLRDLGQTVREGKTDMDLIVLSKSLTKLPEEYADAKSHPHVQVAMRIRDQRKQAIRVGLRIPYIIGINKSSTKQEEGKKRSGLGDRAYSIEEVKESQGDIEIDWEWYLGEQVFPPVSRLCEHMNGTDESFLAECLGLDKNKYRGSVAYTDEKDDAENYTFMNDLMGTEDDEAEKYRNCKLEAFSCGQCGTAVDFGLKDKIMHCAQERRDGNMATTLEIMCCQKCGEELSLARVMNHIQTSIRGRLAEFYGGWLSMPTNTSNRTRIAALAPTGYGVVNSRIASIRPEVTSQELHLNLQYYLHLFDWENTCKRLLQQLHKDKDRQELKPFVEKVIGNALDPDEQAKLERLKLLVERYLKKCARRYVDLSNLFSMVVKT